MPMWEAMITSSGFHTLCASCPNDSSSLVKDAGVEDEHIEVVIPPLLENYPDVT